MSLYLKIGAILTLMTACDAVNLNTRTEGADVLSLKLDAVQKEIGIGDTTVISAIATDSLGTIISVSASSKWTVDESMKSCSFGSAPSPTGIVVLGMKSGKCGISASFGGKTAKLELAVNGPKIKTLTLDPSTADMKTGETLSFKLQAVFDDGTTGDLTSVATWSTSSEGATLSADGPSVTAIAAGTDFVFAKLSEEDITASAKISIVLANNPPSLSFVDPGISGALVSLGSNYAINFTASDTEDHASIALYYSSTSTACSAALTGWNLLQANILESVTTYSWDTSPLVVGSSYRVCAKISDAINPDVYVISNGSVTINAAPSITFSNPVGNNDAISYGTSSFVISWTDSDVDDNASISLYYKSSNTGACSTGTLITNSLSEDADGGSDSHTWNPSSIAPGTYYLCARIADPNLSEEVWSGSLVINTPPSLSITAPVGSDDSIAAGSSSYSITWTDSDSDDNAAISIYYKANNSGACSTGTLITNALTEDADGGSDAYTWNPSALSVGTYYICMRIADSLSSAEYWSDSLVVNAVPSISVVAPTGNDDVIAIGATSFSISWTDADSDDNAAISIYYKANNSGACSTGTLITNALTENADGASDTYTWNPSALIAGTYYLCLRIADTLSNAEVWSGSLVVNAPPTLSITAPVGNDDSIALNATFSSVTWTDTDADSNASISIYYKSANTGACSTGTLLTNALTEDADGGSDSYAWDANGIAAGTYYICMRISDGISAAEYWSGSLIINATPALTMTAPVGDDDSLLAGTSTSITWTASDSDNVASIALYAKTANTGACDASSTLITSGLTEGTDTSYSWSPTLGSNYYYICARISDGINAPVDVYSGRIHLYRNCAWTGTTSTDWNTSTNWTSCNGGAPTAYDHASIPSAPSNQPLIASWISVCTIGGTTGGGGTISLNQWANATIGCGYISESIKFKSTTNTADGGIVSGFTIHNNATVTLERGASVGTVTVGTSSSAGFLVSNNSAHPEAEWPRMWALRSDGPSTAARSGITINGVVYRNNQSYGSQTIIIGANTELIQFDDMVFANRQLAIIDWNSAIEFSSCASVLISDTTWTRLDFAKLTGRADRSYVLNYPANCATAITMDSPSGLTYGPWYDLDPGAQVTWPSITHQNCKWKTSAGSNAWHDPANWDSCSARTGVPDGNDYIEIPSGASPMPVVSVSTSALNFAGGTGGGTVTINDGVYLAMTDEVNTFQNNISFQGATATCSNCNIYAFNSMTVNNNATLTMRSGIRFVLGDYWNWMGIGGSGTAGHLVVIGGSNSSEYARLGLRGFGVGGTAANRSTVNIDGLYHGGSSNNTVIHFGAYSEILKFDRFQTGHAMYHWGFPIMNFSDCTGSLVTDTTWTDHNYSGTPTAGQTENITVSSGCTAMSVIEMYGTGPTFGATWEIDPVNKINWN